MAQAHSDECRKRFSELMRNSEKYRPFIEARDRRISEHERRQAEQHTRPTEAGNKRPRPTDFQTKLKMSNPMLLAQRSKPLKKTDQDTPG